MNTEDRVLRLENAFVTLVELRRNLEERVGRQQTWINILGEARSNAGVKIATLADAQLRTKEALIRLAEAQAHTDRRLDALIDIVREGPHGQSPKAVRFSLCVRAIE